LLKRIRERGAACRLGRHIEHDPRSFAYMAGTAAIRTTMHRHYGPPLDQGYLGSCTGNAMAQSLNTTPFHKSHKRLLREDAAVKLYAAATALDEFPGAYPPEDTGSSGLAVMKAAKLAGYISGYSHTFSIEHLLGALVLAPGILGVNWYESFDDPKPNGECPLLRGAEVRGGHEIAMLGLDAERERVWCINSWGRWGYRNTGRFWFSFATLRRLLRERGDATFARPIGGTR
jgi:hypothetical protein